MRLLVRQQHSWETDVILWVNMTVIWEKDFQVLTSMKPIPRNFGKMGRSLNKHKLEGRNGCLGTDPGHQVAQRPLSPKGGACMLSPFSGVQLWRHHGLYPVTVGFCRQESWSRLSCPPLQRIFPIPGANPVLFLSPALAGGVPYRWHHWAGCSLFCLVLTQQCCCTEKAMTNQDSISKADSLLCRNGLSSQGCAFSSHHVWIWVGL